MDRITLKTLKANVAHLNRLTGAPEAAYTRQADGSLCANIGHYHISQAYGGVMLARMANENGGIDCPLGHGHVTKRELYDQLWAYIRGIEVGMKLTG